MITVTEGYLIGTLRWINEIRDYKKQVSKYYRDLKKWRELPKQWQGQKPQKPYPKTVSRKALKRAQDFIRSQPTPRGCKSLVAEILAEDFCFSKKQKG